MGYVFQKNGGREMHLRKEKVCKKGSSGDRSDLRNREKEVWSRLE